MEDVSKETNPNEHKEPSLPWLGWFNTLLEFGLGIALLCLIPEVLRESPENQVLGLILGSLCLAALVGFYLWAKKSRPKFLGWMFLGLVVLVGVAIYETTRFGVSGVVVSLPIVLPLLVFVMGSHTKALIAPFRRGK